MKKITAFLLGLSFLFCTSFALGIDINLRWDTNPEPDIQGYKIYMGVQESIDVWNWEQVGDVNASIMEFTYNTPNYLRLFRISAYDTAGHESIRYNAGIFSCPNWEPPIEPTGAGIK